MKKTNLGRRALSLFLCLVMVASCLPAGIMTAVAEGSTTALTITKVADPSTKDSWQTYFGTDTSFNTEFAGAVWTDKSVFTDASAFSNITTDSQGNAVSITMKNPDDLLVALSAMASNMTVSGQASIPTDTMLILDVSGSMNDNQGNNDVAEELAEAANTSIHTLLTSNPNNRVGVVLYSGSSSDQTNDNAAVLLLPLGRYTTGSDGTYVTYTVTGNRNTTETISLDSDVRIEGTSTRPSSTSKEVVGATYIQKGVILAMNQLTASSNTTTVNGVTRKPILVLMSDGAPTLSTTSFTAPGQYNLGDGQASSTNAAQGFVTQLSCAYAKAQVEAKYGTDALFYTIGLGTTNDAVATSVLNPASSNSGIQEFWNRYNAAAEGGTVTVQGNGMNARQVTKISTTLEQNYVDKYIAVTSGTDLAQGLKDAFATIVSDIQLQSKYFPTLVGTSTDLSGYVSFVDKIGTYMTVTDVKGILLHDQLFSGHHLAENFVEGGGILGTEAEPTAAGTAMMEAVRDRLGLDSDETAISLIRNAYYYGQLHYDAATGAYSNYIGWYADADGNYLGFYQEGVTTLPDSAVYTVKSYGFLGETDFAHGVSDTDMMYATVQILRSIATGEETMTLRIPASLIPTVTYEVTLDENGALTGLERTGATYPFRLLYEVGLDRNIDSLNLTDYVSEEYLAANTNADGSVSFYSNQYEVDNSTGFGKLNTYSFFNPSHQNDRYYFQEDSLLYTDQNGTLYTGSSPSSYSGTLYWQHTHYEKVNGTLSTGVHYQPISPDVAAIAVQTAGASTWYVPKNTVRTYVGSFVYYKGYASTYDPAQNPTGTLPYAKIPFVDAYGYSLNDADHSFTIGSTLGNNGKLTVTPATGIKLTKAMAEGVTDPGTAFTFTIENLTDTAASGTYAAILEEADGSRTDTSVTFVSGKATVELKAGQTLYIIGLTAGTQYKITETETDDYVSVGGAVTVTVAANRMAAADFVNAERGKGDLMITKELSHAQAGHTIPESILLEWFWIRVDLGMEFAGKNVQINDGTTIGGWRVGDDGTLLLQIRHGQTLGILDLPEGTEVTVTEVTDDLPDYITYDRIATRDHSGAAQDSDNTVTVYNDANATAILYNTYDPIDTTVDLSVKVNKDFQIESPLASASFTFKLQEYVNGAWSDVDSGTITYSGDSGVKSITLPNALDSITFDTVGDYAYQVIEVIPADGDKLPGITYDRTTWTFSVHVTDIGGQLTATVTDDGVVVGENYEVTFTNTYHTAPVSIDVVKEVTNTAANPETSVTGFLFQAYEANADWTLVDNTADLSVLSDAAGEARFTATYNEPGTHYFVIKEADQGKAGWSYDTTEYRVTVVITQETDGNLTSSVSIVKVTDAGTEAVTGNQITFHNTYDPADASVDLDTAVTKNLAGRTLKAGEFTFAVFENGQASHTSTANAVLVGTNAADGSVDFNGSLTFDKIGTYQYDIVEITGDLGGITYSTRIYDLVVEVTDDGTGKLTASYYFEDSTSETVTFTNTYTAKETSYTVTGNKTLTGKALINDEFTFIMTEVADANGTALNGGKTWTTTNATNGSITFPAITYTAPGIHYYKVTEVQQATAGGITFDQTAYIVTVTVTDNGEGQLAASGTVNADAITFTNHYIPAKTSGKLSGDKVLEGKVLGAGAYQFQLYTSNASWENLGAKGEPVSNDANGKFSFPEIEYTSAGTYYYLVSEVNGGQTIDGVIYDSTTFRVRVTVTDDLKGQLHATTVVFDEDNIPQTGVQFVNTYAVVGDASLVLTGSKTLTGRDMVNGEFVFELYETSEAFTVLGDLVTTATNAAGQFTIKLDYTAANDLGKTYEYKLVEKNAGQTLSGVHYSTQYYLFMVTVEDDGVGGIKLTVTTVANQITEGKLTTVSGLDFENTYYPRSTTVQLAGTKTLEGIRQLNANDFTFELYAADSNFLVSGNALATAKNDGSGKFIFAEQTLNTAGQHYFLVKESAADPIGGVTYDGTVYRVTVTVEDDSYGLLKVTDITYQKVTADGTASASGIAFHNSYTPANATVTVSGSKVLTGKTLEKDMFTFQLFKTGLTFSTEGVTPVEVKNTADGSFTFDTLTFDTVGTYYYVVKELNGGETVDGITYDSTAYQITVYVADNGNGKLIPTVIVDQASAQVTANDGSAAVTGISFRNTYSAASFSFSFLANKVLRGDRELKENDFTFSVYAANDQFVITGDALVTAQNEADGKIEFPVLTIDQVGTFYYVIKETSAAVIPGVTYDTTEFHITVVTVDNGKGQLEIADATAVTAEGIDAGNGMVFTNSYDAEDVNVSLGGTKVLEGKDLTAGEFTFKLQQTDDKFQALEGSLPNQVINTQDGSFTFDSLTFDKAGTYYYVITEENTGNERVTFDETVYHATVTVVDEGGKLIATVSYTKADGTAVTEPAFTNIYTPKPQDVSTNITVKKTVKNPGTYSIGPDGFTFQLTDETGAKLEAVTDKDGLAVFTLSFTEDDIGKTYTYQLTEVNDGKSYVTYSTAVYNISVTVTLSADNKLVLTVTNNDAQVDQVVAEFENTYNPPATPVTGDDMNLYLWFGLLGLSGLALAAAVIFRKKLLK